jgi:hypothetical protein
MYLGLPGRVSEEVVQNFLLSSDFAAKARLEMQGVEFGDLADGLVLCFDCFPASSPLVGQTAKVRKLRDTRVRQTDGKLLTLPSLYSANLSLDFEGLRRCHTQREVACFMVSEVERQADYVFSSRRNFDWRAFCQHLQQIAMTMPTTRGSSDA